MDYQHHVSSRIPNDPRNLDEIDDRIREEHQVHAGPSQDFVVLEIVLKLNQTRFRVEGFKYLGTIFGTKSNLKPVDQKRDKI